jgi:regulator of protease activity HflC (stomatin/prohibitin superfamily)
LSTEFVLFIIFAIIATIAFLAYRSFKKKRKSASSDDGIIAGIIYVVASALAIIFLVFSIFYTVPVRNVGIVTSFNKPTGATTGSGLHPVWPWQRVADFDASIQPSLHLGDKSCITVRIGSLATACVETRIQWQVVESAAPKLYNDYKGDFENLRNNLVESQIQNALNVVFATYNPLSQVNLQTGAVGFDGSKLADQVKTELISRLGNDIKILTVVVPLVHHDGQTEANIRQFQDVVAQSRILNQQKANADLEKQVAATQQSYLTKEFLENKCIEQSVKLGFAPGLCLMQSGIVNSPISK